MNKALNNRLRLAGYILVGCLLLLQGCSVKKNDRSTRFYHNLTTRYNVMFNGANAFKEARTNQLKEFIESYSIPLMIEPATVTNGEEKGSTGGPYDRALEKGRKAIRYHSIRTKPKFKGNWRKDPKKVAFYNKREYNTYLHHAWNLVGQSQYYNQDFLPAMATFAYMTRLYSSDPDIRDEARVQQARCYLALNWVVDAQRILDFIPEDSKVRRKSATWPLVQADLAMRNNQTAQAVNYLQEAVKRCPNKLQRARLNYLCGQLASTINQTDQAKRFYRKVVAAAPPYPLELAAQLRQVEIVNRSNHRKALKRLDRLSHNAKNKDLLDQIYYTKGLILLQQPDTIKAMEAFDLGVEKSVKKQEDYLLCQIKIGDIAMAQRNYLKAQPAFSTAASLAKKNHPRYDEINQLSVNLDELARHAKVVAEQDSLRHLASLPEEERFRIIDSAIVAYKKQAREQARQEAISAQQAQQDRFNQEMAQNDPRRPGGRQPNQGMNQGNGKFYFFNPPLVTQGKIEFERKWGRRTLEDHWRRRKKEVLFSPNESQETDDEMTSADSTASTNDEPLVDLESDPTNRAYYLRSLPFTEEQVAESDAMIVQSLVNMGEVFNVKMYLYDDAINAYLNLLERYPNYPERINIYYNLFMLYHHIGRPKQAEPWANKMRQEFPDDPLAIVASAPGYMERLKANIGLEDRLYESIVDNYFNNRTDSVHRFYDQLVKEYPQTVLFSQATFINGLSYVLDGDSERFRESLGLIIKSDNNSDVAILAQSIFGDLIDGRVVGRGGYSGLNRDFIFNSDSTATDEALNYEVPQKEDEQHLLLIYPKDSMKINTLIYIVSAFNFAYFTNEVIDLEQMNQATVPMMLMKHLPANQTAKYITMAYAPKGLMNQLPEGSLLISISQHNFKALQAGNSLNDYLTFVGDKLLTDYPEAALILDRWEAINTSEKVEEPIEPTEESAVETPTTPITFDISRANVEPNSTDSTTLSTPEPNNSAVNIKENVETTDTIETSHRVLTTSSSKRISYEDARKAEKERIKAEREAKKKREKELKAQQKRRKDELKIKEKARREQLKAQKKERERLQRIREAEMKKREKERKERLREMERQRKERLKERNRKKK